MKKQFSLLLPFIFIVTICSELFAQNGGIRIDSTGINPNSGTSAVLDISSESKGLLFPRMTLLQREAISGPEKGLIVYQTDSTNAGLWVFDGTQWNPQGQKGDTGPAGSPGADGKDWDDGKRIGETGGWEVKPRNPVVSYMKLDGVDGESTDANYENYTNILRYDLKEILALQFDISGPSHRNPQYVEVDVFMRSDRTLPVLFQYQLQNQIFARIGLVSVLQGPGGPEYTVRKALDRAVISSIEQISDQTEGSLNKVTIRAEEIEILTDGITRGTMESWIYGTR